MAIFKVVFWPLTSRHLNGNGFIGCPQVSSLQTYHLYVIPIQFEAKRQAVFCTQYKCVILTYSLKWCFCTLESLKSVGNAKCGKLQPYYTLKKTWTVRVKTQNYVINAKRIPFLVSWCLHRTCQHQTMLDRKKIRDNNRERLLADLSLMETHLSLVAWIHIAHVQKLCTRWQLTGTGQPTFLLKRSTL